jgi:hypothetical protein
MAETAIMAITKTVDVISGTAGDGFGVKVDSGWVVAVGEALVWMGVGVIVCVGVVGVGLIAAGNGGLHREHG